MAHSSCQQKGGRAYFRWSKTSLRVSAMLVPSQKNSSRRTRARSYTTARMRRHTHIWHLIPDAHISPPDGRVCLVLVAQCTGRHVNRPTSHGMSGTSSPPTAPGARPRASKC